MTFLVHTVTVYYDQQQDRLNLLFVDKNEQQLLATMTRHFLKKLLATLPKWIVDNVTQGQNKAVQDLQQQHAIEQFHYQTAQHNISASYKHVEIKQAVSPVMIETMKVVVQKLAAEPGVKSQKIRLSFLDATKNNDIVLAVSPAELHKLMGEILIKVDSWDLDNPWLLDAAVGDSSADTVCLLH
jgi:hypothetical protein